MARLGSHARLRPPRGRGGSGGSRNQSGHGTVHVHVLLVVAFATSMWRPTPASAALQWLAGSTTTTAAPPEANTSPSLWAHVAGAGSIRQFQRSPGDADVDASSAAAGSPLATPPAVRYSHAMAAVNLPVAPTANGAQGGGPCDGVGLVVVHGYNHLESEDWRRDVWLWVPGAEAAHGGMASHWAWEQCRVSGVQGGPVARYGHTVVGLPMSSRALMFGGDDGGNSQPGSRGYTFGAFFGDVWELQLTRDASGVDAAHGGGASGDAGGGDGGGNQLRAHWRPIEDTPATEDGTVPTPRSMHAAVDVPLQGAQPTDVALVQYGGLVAPDGPGGKTRNSAEVWLQLVRLDATTGAVTSVAWRLLSAPDAAPGDSVVDPGRADEPIARHGHSLVRDGDALWLFGGKAMDCGSREAAEALGMRPSLRGTRVSCTLNDLWRMMPSDAAAGWHSRVAGVEWTRVGPQATWRWPSVRSSQSMSLIDGSLLLFGGAVCTPSCECLGDTWSFNLGTDGTGTSGTWLLHSHDAKPTTPGALPTYPGARYRHASTQLVRPGTNAARGHGAHCPVAMFAGESYQPSTYYNDLWLWDPSRVVASVAPPPSPAAAAAATGAPTGTAGTGTGTGTTAANVRGAVASGHGDRTNDVGSGGSTGVASTGDGVSGMDVWSLALAGVSLSVVLAAMWVLTRAGRGPCACRRRRGPNDRAHRM